MKLGKLATLLAFGLCILSTLPNANATDDRSIRPFNAQVPQAALGTAGALLRGTQGSVI